VDGIAAALGAGKELDLLLDVWCKVQQVHDLRHTRAADLAEARDLGLVRGHGGHDPGGRDPECLFYYTWDASARKFTRHTISPFGGGVGTGMQICVADLNADDRPDIAVAGKTGTWVLFNEGAE